MIMARTSIILLLLLVLCCLSSCSSAALRRFLHQPFFPRVPILPPTQPSLLPPAPSPQPQHHQPKLPFSSKTPSSPSSSSPKNPFFFPSYRAPPPLPPSPPIVATFPANISSLLLPHPPGRTHRPALALALSLSLLSLVILAAAAALALHRRRRFTSSAGVDDDDKASRSDVLCLYPHNATTSDGVHPKSRGGAYSPRSEYMYLGTVTSSEPADSSCSSSTNGGIRLPPYRKLGDSPELKPLPPLPRRKLRPWMSEGEDNEENENEEEDEFFSPRGSSANKQQSPPSPVELAETSSRSLKAFHSEKLGIQSFTSRTPSYPRSNSLSNSHSSSPLSPTSIKPFPHQNHPISASQSPSFSSLSSSPNPIENLGTNLDVSGQAKDFPATNLPPPPPPPPPPRFWEAPLVNKSNSEETPKPKLKALHWDKVKASSNMAMVWDRLRPSSFQLNEDMIETLFMANNSNNSKDNPRLAFRDNGRLPMVYSSSIMPPENRVLDPKKSQNIAILLRALNVTIDEVCEGLREGNCDTLGAELLENLLKMAPTKEEESKLREFQDESPFKLGPAEKFLKIMLDIPFAFKRVDALLYIANFDSELEYLNKSFETLEVACDELKNSRMFLKLLEAVLRTGNRMNVGTDRGDAHAFKLDTLLKLVDIKGTDGKTTLLHFVVQEIVRTEGSHISGSNHHQTSENNQQYSLQDEVNFRKLGLQVVSGLSGELMNVKKAAAMDSDTLSSDVAKLVRGIKKVVEVVELNEKSSLKETNQKFFEAMKDFLEKGREEILRIQTQEKNALSSVKEITQYFHGNSTKEEAHPFRIFMVVRDFLSILDGVCKEVGKANERTLVGSRQSVMPASANPILPAFFPLMVSDKQPCDSSESD